MDWFTPHNRKYDSQLVSTNKIQPQFASYGQVLLQKNSHWCLRQSACRLHLLLKCRMWYCWSRKPEFYKIRSHLWHSNLVKDLVSLEYKSPHTITNLKWAFGRQGTMRLSTVQLKRPRSFLQCSQGLALTFKIVKKKVYNSYISPISK